MKTIFASLLGCAMCTAMSVPATAQTFTEWQDLEVNAIHRMPMRTHHFAYESVEAALQGDPAASRNYMSLNGLWRFRWVSEVAMRPKDFYRTDYNDKGWDAMPPSTTFRSSSARRSNSV